MSDLNRVTLIGNIGQEPEFHAFESGALKTTISLGVKRYNKKEEKDDTDWFKVITFAKMGEYLKKGLKVAVDGKLQTDSWESEDGEKRKSTYIFAENVQILTPKNKENE